MFMFRSLTLSLSVSAIVALILNALALCSGSSESTSIFNQIAHAEPTAPQIVKIDETPRFGAVQAVDVKVCELYESLATVKATAETQIDAKCTCALTAETCGKNWRGAQKKVFKCSCQLPSGCQVNACSLSDITATAKATKLCKKTTCSCVKAGQAPCAPNFLGKQSLPYKCDCPQH